MVDNEQGDKSGPGLKYHFYQAQRKLFAGSESDVIAFSSVSLFLANTCSFKFNDRFDDIVFLCFQIHFDHADNNYVHYNSTFQ